MIIQAFSEQGGCLIILYKIAVQGSGWFLMCVCVSLFLSKTTSTLCAKSLGKGDNQLHLVLQCGSILGPHMNGLVFQIPPITTQVVWEQPKLAACQPLPGDILGRGGRARAVWFHQAEAGVSGGTAALP